MIIHRFSKFITITLLAGGLGLAACQPKPSVSPVDELYGFKTDYVGDNSKVSAIVRSQPYQKAIQIDGIEILSNAPPYGLKVLLDTDQPIAAADLQPNAIVTFALIGNLDHIDYVHKNGGEIIASFERQQSQQQLQQDSGKTLAELGGSAEDLAVYLHQ